MKYLEQCNASFVVNTIDDIFPKLSYFLETVKVASSPI